MNVDTHNHRLWLQPAGRTQQNKSFSLKISVHLSLWKPSHTWHMKSLHLLMQPFTATNTLHVSDCHMAIKICLLQLCTHRYWHSEIIVFDQIQLRAVPHADMWSKGSVPGPDQEILTDAACCSRLDDRKNAILSVCTSCTASSEPENSGFCGVSLEVCEDLQICGADLIFWSRKWTFLRCCSSDTWTRICWISASIWTHISSSV